MSSALVSDTEMIIISGRMNARLKRMRNAWIRIL
jgi:hypothetical protein